MFKTLRPEHLEKILEIELGMVQQRMLSGLTGNNQFVFSCTAKVKTLLLQEGTDPKYGARHLKRAIEKHLVFPLANLVATAQVKLGRLYPRGFEYGRPAHFRKRGGRRHGAHAAGTLRSSRRHAGPGRPRRPSRRSTQRIRRNSCRRHEAVNQLRPCTGAGHRPAPFLLCAGALARETLA